MEPDVIAMLWNLSQITAQQVMLAGQNPGLLAGTLMRPYASATIRFDPSSNVYTVSRPSGDARTSDDMEAARILGDSWREDLMELRRRNPAQYAQAVKFISDHT